MLIAELDHLKAVTLGRIADVEMRGLASLDAAPSTSSWVERQAAGLGRDDVALARKLPRMPEVAGCVAEGSLSLAAATMVGQALDKVRPHVDRPDGCISGHDGEQVLANVIVEDVLAQLAEVRGGYADDDPELPRLVGLLVEVWERPAVQLARLEAAFVLLAQQLERCVLGQALDRLVDAVLPDRLSDAADQAHAQRGLVLRKRADGSGYTIARGDLDLELGAYLTTVLAAARATDPDNSVDTVGWSAERDDADGVPGPRSRAQQDHDALRLALRRLLDSGELGTRGKAAPHLLLTATLGAMHDEPGALLPRTADGTSLPVGLVRRLLCDSRLTRVVLSLGRRVLEVSHSERTLKAHERQALQVQWGGRCAGAGCTSPPGALIPHHANAWHRTGSTSLADTVPFCATTHHDLHEGGRVILLRDGRYLGPDGWADGPDG